MCIRDRVCSVDRNSAASRHETNDLVARNRAAALGETNRKVMDAFYDDAAL